MGVKSGTPKGNEIEKRFRQVSDTSCALLCNVLKVWQ